MKVRHDFGQAEKATWKNKHPGLCGAQQPTALMAAAGATQPSTENPVE
jgi:hypothetical protein